MITTSKWIVIAVCIISGTTTTTNPDERSAREAPAPNKFKQLTTEENVERLENCGKLKWAIDDSVPSKWHGAAFYPWVVRMIDMEDEMNSDTAVIISKWHMLADGHALRNWNLSSIFADRNVTATGPLSAIITNSPSTINALYCTGPFAGKCQYSRFKASPSKVMIDKFEKPRFVLFEFEKEIPIEPICVPEMELIKGEEVFVQHREEAADQLSPVPLFDFHMSGFAVLQTSSAPGNFSQVLVKKEGGRYTIAANFNKNTNTANSTYQMFSSVFKFTDLICTSIGACPSVARAHFQRLSKTENEDRLRKCGRLPKPHSNEYLESIYPNFPWTSTVTRDDGHIFTAVVVAKRHILTNWTVFEGIDLTTVFKDIGKRNTSTITSHLPLVRNSTEVLNFAVTVSVCLDETCESKKNETLIPQKLQMISGSYVVLEMGHDLNVTPICLAADWPLHFSDDFFGLLTNGTTNRNHIYENDGNETSIDVFQGDRETMMHKRGMLFTVIGIPRAYNNERNLISLRQWSYEQGKICAATGICSKTMSPIPLTVHESGKLKYYDEWSGEGEICGKLSNDSTHSSPPWLVGIRTNGNSSAILTGILISRRHILMDGTMFGSWDDLSELFGDFRNRQPQMLRFELPEYDLPINANIEVLMKECVDDACTSQKEITKKPSSLLLHDSTDPSVLILKLNEDLATVPICLENREDVKRNDEVFVQQYTQLKVASVDDQRIVTSPQSSITASKFLVRKHGNRYILVGYSPLTDSPNSTSSGEFISVFSLRFKICALVGVCPPWAFRVEFKKISEEEDEERSKTCGLLNPLHSQPGSPQEPSIARQAPWLVGIQGPEARVHTGVVISRRHVFTDIIMMETDVDYESVTGTGEYYMYGGYSSTLPIPRSNFQLKVTMNICVDQQCSETVEKEMIPTNMYLSSSSDGFMILLEFDNDIPVTPICIPHDQSHLKADDEIFVQDFTDPQSITRSTNVSESGFKNKTLHEMTYSKMIVRKDNGQFAVVAYNQQLKIFQSGLRSLSHNLKFLCETTGVCATVSYPIQDASPIPDTNTHQSAPEDQEEDQEDASGRTETDPCESTNPEDEQCP